MFSTISAKVKAKQIEVSQLCVQLQPSLESLPIPLLARPANASSRPEPSDYKSWNQRKSDGHVKVRTVQVLDGDLAIGDLALAQFRWRSSTWRSSTCTVLTCTSSPVLDLQFCSNLEQNLRYSNTKVSMPVYWLAQCPLGWPKGCWELGQLSGNENTLSEALPFHFPTWPQFTLIRWIQAQSRGLFYWTCSHLLYIKCWE